jgi:hypothetical protein
VKSKEWKELINQELKEKEIDAELRTPEVGEQKAPWMSVANSGSGGSVKNVANWAVMTRDGTKIHSAEIEV